MAMLSSSSSSASLSSVLNQLPTDLIIDKDVFINVMTNESIWKQLLDDNKKSDLMDKYLPNDLTESDKEETIDLLLSQSLTRFNGDEALNRVFERLRLHKMSPEVVKAMDDVKMMRNKLRKLCEQKRQCQLLNEIMTKRSSLFDASIALSVDCDIKCKSHNNHVQSKSKCSILKKRSKMRYHKEMKDIRVKCDDTSSSDDEEMPIAWDRTLSSKCVYDNKYSLTEKEYREMLRKHRRKRKAHDDDSSLYEPSLETSNITLSDIIMRVTNCSINNNTINNNTSSLSLTSSIKSSSISSPISGKTVSTSSSKKRSKPLQSINKSISHNISNGLSLSQSLCRGDIESDISNKSDKSVNHNDNKNDIESRSNVTRISPSIAEPNVPTYLSSSGVQSPESPLIVTPLPALPPLLPSSPEPSPLPLSLEKSPACFFSVLRDIFALNATNDHRLTLHKLEELVKDKLRYYDPFLGWSCEMVASAMNYLSGVLPPPHLIPLVDYKEKNQQWQWIGVGRDLDSALIPLCEEWTKNRDDDPTVNIISLSQTVPPPAKCLTDWIVRPSSDEEKMMYRQQEAVRYHNPNKAFTYRVHGYESVVGPVKGCGIGGANANNISSPNKAREHSLLVNDRPPFVTLLSLVRDAAARLPNGEGTRADICELLKDSQYLLPTISDQQVNGIVSGALDRLHYEKDPCVKYDVNRKVWIYLHRNRTEAEFERLHEVQIAAAKAKRSMNKSSRRNNGNSLQSNLQKQQSQSSIISKTTQQAIHQAVTNILNSEALKVTPNSSFNTLPSSSAMSLSTIQSDDGTNLSNTTMISSKDSIDDDSKDFEINSNMIESSSVINGATSTITPSGSVMVSLPSKDITKSRLIQTHNLPIFGNKNTKSKDDIIKLHNEPKMNIDDNTKSSDATVVSSSPNSSLSTVSVSTNLTNLLTNHNDIITNKIPTSKPRQIRQSRQTVKVQLPKTISIPITLAQNQQLPHQSTPLSPPNDGLPTIISVTNPLHKHGLISNASTVQHQKALSTKIIPAQFNNTINSPASSNTAHQISIPTSVLFGTRPGSVVLATPTGKSYMMAATGGSIVLQQNATSPNVTMTGTTSSQTPSLAVRTLQGIRVIPLTAANANPSVVKTNSTITSVTPQHCNSQTIVSNQPQSLSTGTVPTQHHHQLVARIITTTQPNRGHLPQTQIVIPSSSTHLQPLFYAHPQQSGTTNTTLLQHLTPSNTNTQSQLQKAKLSITIPRTTS